MREVKDYRVIIGRNPLEKDSAYKVYTHWVNKNTGAYFILSAFIDSIPRWRQINGNISEGEETSRRSAIVNNEKVYLTEVPRFNLSDAFTVSVQEGLVKVDLDISKIEVDVNGTKMKLKNFTSIKINKPILTSMDKNGNLIIDCENICGLCVEELKTFQKEKEDAKGAVIQTVPEFEPSAEYEVGQAILYSGRLYASKRNFTSGDFIDFGDWEALWNVNKEIVTGGGSITTPNEDSRYKFEGSNKVAVVKTDDHTLTFDITENLIEGFLLADDVGSVVEPSLDHNGKPKITCYAGLGLRIRKVVGGLAFSILDGEHFILGDIRDWNLIKAVKEPNGDLQFKVNTAGDLLPTASSPEEGISIEWGAAKGSYGAFASNYSYTENETIYHLGKAYTAIIDFVSAVAFDENDWRLLVGLEIEGDDGNALVPSNGRVGIIGSFETQTHRPEFTPDKLAIISSRGIFDMRKRTPRIMAYGSFEADGTTISSHNLGTCTRVSEGIYEVHTTGITTSRGVDFASAVGSVYDSGAGRIAILAEADPPNGFNVLINTHFGALFIDSAFDIVIACTCEEDQPNREVGKVNLNPIVCTRSEMQPLGGGVLYKVYHNVVEANGITQLLEVVGIEHYIVGDANNYAGGQNRGFYHAFDDPSTTIRTIQADAVGSFNDSYNFLVFNAPEDNALRGLSSGDVTFPINVEFAGKALENGTFISRSSATLDETLVNLTVTFVTGTRFLYSFELPQNIVGANMIVLASGQAVTTRDVRVISKTLNSVAVEVQNSFGMTIVILSF